MRAHVLDCRSKIDISRPCRVGVARKGYGKVQSLIMNQSRIRKRQRGNIWKLILLSAMQFLGTYPISLLPPWSPSCCGSFPPPTSSQSCQGMTFRVNKENLPNKVCQSQHYKELGANVPSHTGQVRGAEDESVGVLAGHLVGKFQFAFCVPYCRGTSLSKSVAGSDSNSL